MAVTVSAMFIPVHDPGAALGFYRDALGLEVRGGRRVRRLPPGHRWRSRGERRHRSAPAPRRSFAGRGDSLLSLVTKGSLQAAIFRSGDLDTTFENVRASGAEVLQEPMSQPWGVRDCAFRDPSCSLPRIAQT